MARYVEGRDRSQSFLLPENIDDYVGEENPVRAVEAFVDALDLAQLRFGKVIPAETGRPSYHPSTMLKIYLYGYLKRIQSSRRLDHLMEALGSEQLVRATRCLALRQRCPQMRPRVGKPYKMQSPVVLML